MQAAADEMRVVHEVRQPVRPGDKIGVVAGEPRRAHDARRLPERAAAAQSPTKRSSI
jgi:hypothetical protein